MTALWPPSLPQGSIIGATQQQDANYNVRTQMDVGPPKVRARATTYRTTYQMQIVTDNNGVADFLAFYRSTLNNGTEIFSWTDPISAQTTNMRFVGPASINAVAVTLFQIDFTVETP